MFDWIMARKKKEAEKVEVPVEAPKEESQNVQDEAFKKRHKGAREGVIYE